MIYHHNLSNIIGQSKAEVCRRRTNIKHFVILTPASSVSCLPSDLGPAAQHLDPQCCY